MTDNIIRRKDKASWGFTQGEDGQIKLGVPTPDEKADDIRTVEDDEEARGNGGGFPAEDQVTYEYLHSLTKPKLLELAEAHEITLDNPKANKDDLLAELEAYYEVKPAQE